MTDDLTQLAHDALDEAEAASAEHRRAAVKLASLEREHSAARLAAEHRLQDSQGWSQTRAEKMVRVDPEFLAHVVMEDEVRNEMKTWKAQAKHAFERARIFRASMGVPV